jgi:hypothetical protein
LLRLAFPMRAHVPTRVAAVGSKAARPALSLTDRSV